MVEDLRDRDEEVCVENAAVGSSTYVVFLNALKRYCHEFINVTTEGETFESRYLYKVELNLPLEYKSSDDIPVIMIDAGMQGGEKSIMFALYIIEQISGCAENEDMLTKVKWVILPSINPDGFEYSRHERPNWNKNMVINKDSLSIGVDISRNFDIKWSTCEKSAGMSPSYQGEKENSENETIFVKDVMLAYKNRIKAYVSIRRDGHSLLYPYGYTKDPPNNIDNAIKVAQIISDKVNQKAGTVQVFVNESIFNVNAVAHCGNSVDYAFDLEIPLAYEMRVFMGKDSEIMSKFRNLPRGFESSLRTGYFNGIRELFKIITQQNKYGIKL